MNYYIKNDFAMHIHYREMTSDDIAEMTRIADDAEIQKLTLFIAANERKDSLEKVFNDLAKANENGVVTSYVILNHEVIVGFMSRYYMDETDNNISIGYWVDASERGRNFGKIAVNQLVRDILKHHPDATLHASIRPDNIPSIKIIEDIGFVEHSLGDKGMIQYHLKRN